MKTEKKGMIVLSLFDGMSCGQIALERAGIKVDKYLASEVKPHAIELTQKHYPKTIQIGDVTKVRYENGTLYTENGNFDVGKIDLVIGGSPCQDFSQANRKVTGLKGEKSKLFFEYLRICHEVCPYYFLLENVRMKKEYEEVITRYLGVPPITIDSSLVSPALRKRTYWTNVPMIGAIEDKSVFLQDILERGYTDRIKARCLLESDSRPSKTPVKMFHRYYTAGFTTLIFKNKQHYEDCITHYDQNYKGLAAKDISCTSKVYDGVRYLTTQEREKCQTLPPDYCKSLTDNEAACLIGDGWTVDVIAHIFKGLKYETN